MKERAIRCYEHEVRAILAGTQMQMRRIVKPQPVVREGWSTRGVRPQPEHPIDGIEFAAGTPRFSIYAADHLRHYEDDIAKRFSPYGVAGDRLWVRETWRSWDETCITRGDCADEDHVHSPHCQQTYVAYAATPRVGFRPVPDRARITYLDESTPLDRNPRLLGPWRPSIFMKRAASRITLEVVSVRVERLQDITEGDAKAEGAPCEAANDDPDLRYQCAPGTDLGAGDGYSCPRTHVAGFANLWDAINGKRAPWASNPWVWRVAFRRVQP